MPTNPLWMEHTEKAAWETVRALREQVEEERARADRLLRLEPTLPRLAELLDEARELLDLEAQAPAVVLEQVLARLRKLSEERRTLERELAARPPASPAPSRPQAPPSVPEAAASERGRKPSALRWFASQLERRRRERAEEEGPEPARGSLAEVAAQVEGRLRELVPLPYAPSALRTAALDLGLAALDLARAARRAERDR